MCRHSSIHTTPSRLLVYSKVPKSSNQPTMSASPSASDPSLSTSAYVVPSKLNSSSSASDDEFNSLPSEPTTSDLETVSDDDDSDAEEEWRESIEQLELLLSMVLVPFMGKYLGRKCAYWSMRQIILYDIIILN